ncbi:MAG: hypothetical protein KJO07_25195 [Deltaproteobacteria bacterium]|jgi:hypothetical protein|nr:hypothetical protein [Deltaproteobacteria bacterium]
MRLAPLLILVCSLAALPARAQRRDSTPSQDDESPASQSWFNLRAGSGSLGAGSGPVICAEVSPWGPLSLETCGTGAGLFRDQQGDDVAHFRAKWRLLQRVKGPGVVKIQTMLGFAELEVGDDDPGFRFTGSGARGVETAGPEAGFAVQYLASLGRGVEGIASLTAGMAYFPYADDLVTPRNRYQPFVGVELGAGF